MNFDQRRNLGRSLHKGGDLIPPADPLEACGRHHRALASRFAGRDLTARLATLDLHAFQSSLSGLKHCHDHR